MSASIINDDSIKSLFKPGYEFKVETYDFDSAEIKKEIAQSLRDQAISLERTGVIDTQEYLNSTQKEILEKY